MRFALPVVCLIAVLSLGGCVLPPALSVVSFVGDGVSVVTSGKSMSDNAISTLAGEDCQLFRVLKGEWICHPKTNVVAVADLPPPPPEPPLTVVSPYPRPAEPVMATVEPVTPPVSLPTIPTADPVHPKEAATASPPPAAPAPAAATVKPPAPALVQRPQTPATRPTSPAASTKPARATAPAPQQAAAPATPRSLGGPPVRGEMVIQGGTSQADAEAIAGQLKGFSAKVRPVEKNGVTTYDVVVGLSG